MSSPITNYLTVTSKSEKDNVKLYKFFYNNIIGVDFGDLALNEKTKAIFGSKLEGFLKKNTNASVNAIKDYIYGICGSDILHIDSNEDEEPMLPEEVTGDWFEITLTSGIPTGFYKMFSKYFNVDMIFSYTVWHENYEGTVIIKNGKTISHKKEKSEWT